MHVDVKTLKTMRQHDVHMSFGTKEGEVESSQVDEREQTLDEWSLAGPPRSREMHGILGNGFLLGFLSVALNSLELILC